jgi:hypothetical protein
MYVAILIGFTYKVDPIKSVIFDLYRVYEFVRNAGAACFVLTDYDTFDPELESHVSDPQIRAFCIHPDPDLVPCPDVTFYTVRSMQDVMLTIKSIDITGESQVMFYYTGHGDADQKMRFPNGQRHDLIEVRNLLLNQCSPAAEIFMVMDCCNSGSLGLPYGLSSESSKFRLRSVETMTDRVVLLISASSETEKAGIVSDGSYFTKYLFEVLHQKLLDLGKIRDIIQSKVTFPQTITISSSYPVESILWTWIFYDDPRIAYVPLTSSLMVINDNPESNFILS